MEHPLGFGQGSMRHLSSFHFNPTEKEPVDHFGRIKLHHEDQAKVKRDTA